MTGAYALAYRPGGAAALRSLRLTGEVSLGAGPPLSLAAEGVKPRHARIARNGDVWAVSPGEGPVQVNGVPAGAATPLRSGDVLGLGAATVTFFEETLPEAGEPGGNGFSRASRALGRALDGLPASEQELLRQLAELEESLEKAPLAAASLKMSTGDFRAAAEVLSVAQAGLGSNFQLGLHLGICLAKTEQFEDADRVLERVFLDAPDHATKQQALDLRRQALLARQQKLFGKQLEQAVQHLQGERFLDASAIFEQLPPDLKNEPSVKLMAAIARVKLILSVPVQPGGRGVLALHLSNTLGDVEDVISRAQDAFTRSQAMGLKSQLQTLLRQLS